MQHSIATRRVVKAMLLAVGWSVIALLFLVAAHPPEPPNEHAEVTPPKRPPIVAAWLQRTRGVPGPLVVIIAPRLNIYNELSPHSYTIERDGSLTINDPVADEVLIDFARTNSIRYVPTVSTGWENGSRLSRILGDRHLRAAHVKAIMEVARSPLIDGIDLDYENLPPEARSPYVQFVTELAASLHKEGKLLSVTVPPKVRADDPCVFCRYADYAAIGAVADRFRVMAYEYHGKNGPPGPVAPVWWMRQVMSYTVSVVPPEKVSLGIHLYGYDWGGAETPALWWSEVQALKERYNGQVSLVESDERGVIGESVLTYTIPSPRCPRHDVECVPDPPQDHTVWFVDARYVAPAWDIVKNLKLGGIVMWRPGGEDPAIWDIINPPTTGK